MRVPYLIQPRKFSAVFFALFLIVNLFLSFLITWRFGWEWQSLAALVFLNGLIFLSVIDIQYQLLPDRITLTWLWMGLLCNVAGLFTSTQKAVLGALLGYLSLW